MDKNRVWTIGSVLAMVVLVAAGFFFGVQPQLAAAAAADADRAGVAATNAGHEAVLARLKDDFRDLDRLRDQSRSLARSVPTGTAMPAFFRQIDRLTAGTEVRLTGLTVADPLAYTPVVAAPTTVVDPNVVVDPNAVAAPAPISTAGVPPVANARITAANFAAMAVTLSITGSFDQVLEFVNGLQSGDRLFLVSAVNTKDSARVPGNVDATISGLVYSLVPVDPAVGLPADSEGIATATAAG